ncbi:xylose isomerase [Verrucomicrobia bacterium IMCC26134]|nr:xylose isomerase [Verrucomicrobia bacterium IMCC26134]
MKQSFAWWCFANRGVEPEALLSGAARLGYEGVDLLDEALWPLARRHGLTVSAALGHGTLTDGLNRPANAARIETELRANIARAAAAGIPVLICFSGNRAPDLDDKSGLATAAATLARVAPQAEAAGVILALELLNSRVDHPGYMADRTAWAVRLCEQVNSPAVRVLYDIYHAQIMEGDILRTIDTHHRWFAHYHTAGNPGRGEFGGNFDRTQELNYAAILSAIRRTGFTGFVAHEFIPVGDPLAALARVHAFTFENQPSDTAFTQPFSA